MTWQNTTHDWSSDVAVAHLERIRLDPATFAPGGVTHLVLEVLAYAADEAESSGAEGLAVVTLHDDGSVSVADNGRGTDTRVDAEGRTVKKPVMATKDLRFFDAPSVSLPDGHLRRGMSVVAALSEWLVHTNRRLNGSWTQRYEHGIPVTDLTPVESDGTTGTTVHFSPSPGLAPVAALPTDFGPHLTIEVRTA
ncbi:ATP-binding protein [Actinophytocola algeriensis]|uniref:DNA topoisomerase (ATP-hydrolyzing) n=1 Tax=Actinophytocola algeriensis TaxID=1768010 RepID=A0A7W7QAH9_9PSEU|nr:ATP-binding protein [Actinophytocola algeriensis]MBB4910052.1 DNA gyrase subunit B [Actinophytocola algeriensis]MBE1476042.1 DNA gyrase subunit B [Actinophytocola algeriensis]